MEKPDLGSIKAVRHLLNQNEPLKTVEIREMFLRHCISTNESATGADELIAYSLLDLYYKTYSRAYSAVPQIVHYYEAIEEMGDFFIHGIKEVWPSVDRSAISLLKCPYITKGGHYPLTLIRELAWLLGYLEGERLSKTINQA